MRGMGLIQHGEDGIHNIVCLLQRIVVPESEHPKSQLLQHSGATLVVGDLPEVLAAVEFNNEISFDAYEVQDVTSHAMLASELHSKLPVAQALPKQCLRIGL